MVRKDGSVSDRGAPQLEASKRSQAASLREELTDPRQLVVPQLETMKIFEVLLQRNCSSSGDY